MMWRKFSNRARKMKRPFPTVLRFILGYRAYLMLLSAIVGIICGLAGVFLKTLVHNLHELTAELSDYAAWMKFVAPLFPAVGIFGVLIFVHGILRLKTYEKSLAGVIKTTTVGSSELPLYKMFSHLLTSGWAVGCGVSAGLEAPMALTGSAIGSNFAKLFNLNSTHRKLLLACGGAAGIAAMFNSPIAGAMFACEVLLPRFTVGAMPPLLVASVMSMLVCKAFGVVPSLLPFRPDWEFSELPYFAVLGLVSGWISFYVSNTTLKLGREFGKMANPWLRALLASFILYAFFLLLPGLAGEGYDNIMCFVRQNPEQTIPQCSFLPSLSGLGFTLLIAVLLLLKPLVSVASIEGGGDGGIFGPSLFIGGALGYVLVRLAALCGYSGLTPFSVCNSVALGMAGIISGVMLAPLTGMFLIAEMTESYALLVPLMLVVSLSYLSCRRLRRFNLYKTAWLAGKSSTEIASLERQKNKMDEELF